MNTKIQDAIDIVNNEILEIDNKFKAENNENDDKYQKQKQKIFNVLEKKNEKLLKLNDLKYQKETEDRKNYEKGIVIDQIKAKNHRGKPTEINCPICISYIKEFMQDRNSGQLMLESQTPKIIKMLKIDDGDLTCPYCSYTIKPHMQF